MKNKDLFSGHSSLYAAFRPTYPESLYAFIFTHLNTKTVAWDCATGNGQVAKRLALDFDEVYATDISEQQLRHAHQGINIHYSQKSAEQSGFPENTFDLITVGQALHWFNLDLFFREIRRVAKPGGLFAAWGYAHLEIQPEIDRHIRHFYNDVVGKYWDDARKIVEDEYASVTFPFDLIQTPRFYIETFWTLKHLEGYLESWSATQAFIRDQKWNPVQELKEKIAPHWPDGASLDVKFPLFLKAGRI